MSRLYSPVDSAFVVSAVVYHLLWCVYCCVPCCPLVVSENCGQCPCSSVASVCCFPPGIHLAGDSVCLLTLPGAPSSFVSVVMTTGQRLSGSLEWHHSVVLLSSVTRSVACPVLSQLPLCLPSPRTCFLASTPHLLVVLAEVPPESIP